MGKMTLCAGQEDAVPPFLGFVLVTHSQPEQTAFLCWKLSSLFDHPPIAIHHDYSKCHLDPASLPPQVRLVKDWVKTAWGAISLVDAYLAALRLLHSESSPEWTISLSGADYPVKSAEHILHDLRSTAADALLDFREIRKHATQVADARSPTSHYQHPDWVAAAWRRYLGFSVVHYHVRKLFGRQNRPICIGNRWTTRLLTPFSASFRPFGGDTWHTLDRRAVAVLLADDPLSRKLRHFYRNRVVPDESFYHTILLNRPELTVENDNRRFSIWIDDSPHPKVLEYADLPAMVASNAHFARKFPFDVSLYRAVDAEVKAQQAGLTFSS